MPSRTAGEGRKDEVARPPGAASASVLKRASQHEWLVGGGEMGKVIRSMDWSETPLGPIESWPQSLRTTVSLCLASNFPISLAWGPKPLQISKEVSVASCAD